MELTFKFRIFIVALIISRCSSSSQTVSLIGSRFLADNSTYKAFLLTKGLNDDSSVKVAFGPKGGHPTVFEDVDRDFFKEIDFNVAFDDFTDYELSITIKLKNTCKEQSVDVYKTSDVPNVFIQFNKPIYRTSEIFNFKVFILSQKLLPMSKVSSMNIALVNPRRIVWSHDKVSEVSKFGVYENSVKLWDIPNFGSDDLGIWTVNVDVDGKKTSKSFEVQYLSQSESEVFVQVPSEVAFEDRRIYLNIYTKDPRNRLAAIYLTARFVNSSQIQIEKHVKSEYLTDIKTVAMLDFKQDFGISFPTNDMLLTFRVDIVHGQKTTTVLKEVKMKHKGRHTIQVVRKKYFKPGFKFPVKIRVKLLDGVLDNSFNQLSTTIKYLSNSGNGDAGTDEKNYSTNLKKGETVHVLHTKAATTKIVLQLKFADTEHTEEIERFPGVDKYLQVSMLNKSTKVGTTVQMRAQSSEDMEQLHLIVFGTKGIVHSQNFEDAVVKDVFDFPLELTDEMRPEARGLVFYTRASDGAMVYDEFSLSIGLTIDNSLEISAPEEAKPNEMVKIEVKTEKDSQVILMAIDANSELFDGHNGISRNSVYSEIAHHLNRKFANPSSYQFEKINGFVLEPINHGQNCNSGRRDDKELLESQSIKASSQKYFPDTLPELKFIASSEVQTVQMKMPDSTTRWKIYGISVHPTKDFTVSKTNPEIAVQESVKSGVEVEIIGPSTVRQGEVHKIKIIAKNLQPSFLNGLVTLNIEDGSLLGEKLESSSWNLKCRKYFIGKLPLSYNVQFTQQESMNAQTFSIRAKNDKPIKIKVKFESAQGKSEAATDITVEASRIFKSETVSTNLIELNQKNPNFKLELPKNASSARTFVDVHGNLLGPALDGLEKVFGRKMFLDEEKVLKFKAAVINYKFLNTLGQSNSDKARAAKREIFEGGKEAIDILRRISEDQTRLWLSSFIIGTLQDAEGLFIADQKLISKTLDFIAAQQLGKQYRNAGSFVYSQDTDDHKDIGTGMRQYIQSAQIITAFMKFNAKSPQYQRVISNSLDSLYLKIRELTGDPVDVMMAYTFAQLKDKQKSTEFIKRLKHGYATPKAPFLKKHHSMYVEVLSYLILTKILNNEDPRGEVEKLLAHRKVDGRFYSPYDTVIALEALHEYSKYRKSGRSFVLEIDGQQNIIGKLESKQFGPFTDPNHELIITTQGLGYAVAHQEVDGAAASSNSISSLTTSAKKIGSKDVLEIGFNFQFAPQDQTLNINLLVLEVVVPKGYAVNVNKQNDIEVRDNGSTVVLYLRNIKKNIQYRSAMMFVRNNNEPEYIKPLSIKLYDYYRPNLMDTYSYDTLCMQS